MSEYRYARTHLPPPRAPLVPDSIYSTVVSDTQIDVSWDVVDSTNDYDGTDDAPYYTLYHGASCDGIYTEIYSGSDLFHMDVDLSYNTVYYYKLRACNIVACSDMSVCKSATTDTPPVPSVPAAPTLSIVSDTEVDVFWDATDDDIYGNSIYYRLYRDTSADGTYDTMIYEGPYITVFHDTFKDTVKAETIYYYKLEACNYAYGCSEKSPPTATPEPPAIPESPVLAVLSSSEISVSWDLVETAFYYKLYRSEEAEEPFELIYRSEGSEDTFKRIYKGEDPFFHDGGLAGETVYYYKVEACNISGCSGRSLDQWTNTDTNIWNGARMLGSLYRDLGYGVAVDHYGNIYIAGSTDATFDSKFYDMPFHGNVHHGGSDIFVAKYNSSGFKQWSRQFGTEYNDEALDIAIGPSGSVYVTGYTEGLLEGDTSPDSEQSASLAVSLTPPVEDDETSDKDVFIIKYNPSGQREWTRQFGSSGNDVGESLAVDAQEYMYITGYTDGTLDGNENWGETDIILAKYNSIGRLKWAKQFSTSSHDCGLPGTPECNSFEDYGKGVAVDHSGDIYVTGATKADDGIPQDDYEIFLMKRSPVDGSHINHVKSSIIGEGDNEIGRDVVVDKFNNVYVVGDTTGKWDLDATDSHNINSGGRDIFLMKYTSLGNRAWTRLMGDSSDDIGYSVAVDSDDNILVGGYYVDVTDDVGNPDPDPCECPCSCYGEEYYDNSYAVVFKYDSSGDYLGRSEYLPYTTIGYGIAADTVGNAYVVGITDKYLDNNYSDDGDCQCDPEDPEDPDGPDDGEYSYEDDRGYEYRIENYLDIFLIKYNSDLEKK